MPPKQPVKGGKTSQKAGKPTGGKAKKKKWSKGKTRDKLNNLVMFDKATYEKLYKEVPNYKLITLAVVSERLKIRGSLAKKALFELQAKGDTFVDTSDNAYRVTLGNFTKVPTIHSHAFSAAKYWLAKPHYRVIKIE